MAKKKVTEPKKTEAASQQMVTRSRSKKENSKVLRSQTRAKEKNDSASEGRSSENAKSSRKRRNAGKEKLTKREVEDPKKSEVLTPMKGARGRSKRKSAENDEGKSDLAGTSRELRSQTRAKGNQSTDKKTDEEKEKRTRALEDIYAEKGKGPEKKKVEDPRKSKEVVQRKGSYRKPKRDDGDENVKKVSRSGKRAKEIESTETKERGKRKQRGLDDRSAKKANTPQKARSTDDEIDVTLMCLAGSSRSLRSSKQDKGKKNADEMGKKEKGKKKLASEDTKADNNDSAAGTSRVLRSSSRLKGKKIASEMGEVSKKKKRGGVIMTRAFLRWLSLARR